MTLTFFKKVSLRLLPQQPKAATVAFCDTMNKECGLYICDTIWMPQRIWQTMFTRVCILIWRAVCNEKCMGLFWLDAQFAMKSVCGNPYRKRPHVQAMKGGQSMQLYLSCTRMHSVCYLIMHTNCFTVNRLHHTAWFFCCRPNIFLSNFTNRCYLWQNCKASQQEQI